VLKWGVLCTSMVGRLAVIPAIQRSSNGRVLAIASRGLERARQEAERFEIPKAYGSYAELLADPEVEAVYIPLPNSLHLEWVLRAAAAGKQILCEKPLALNAAEVETMIAAAERAGVRLMEAFMYRFHPRSLRVKQLVESGALGPIQLIRSAFAFLHRDPTDYRFKPEMGGGALLDVGGYAVSAARWLIGAEPIEVQASAQYGAASGVDETLAGLLRFPGGELAVVTCSFRTALRQNYEVVGRDAVIEVSLAFVPEGEESPLLILRDNQIETERFPRSDQYQLMVEHFADAVLNDQPLRFPPQEAWANARVLDALAEAARSGQLVRLEWPASFPSPAHGRGSG
jgi:D-xylose 1-dehydrogenase (NADP+, D-xylono-1,5-lactone-forming)